MWYLCSKQSGSLRLDMCFRRWRGTPNSGSLNSVTNDLGNAVTALLHGASCVCPLRQGIYLFIYVFIYLFIYLCIYLCIYLFIHSAGHLRAL